MYSHLSGCSNSQGGREMKAGYEILIVGIGGQGTILASNILGEACLIEGRPVKGAETHGMAQRGGSVESHIRIDGMFGPLIAPGTADLIISFDLLEALRYAHYLKDGGEIFTNCAMVIPTSVYTQGAQRPEAAEIQKSLDNQNTCYIEADRLAQQAGSIMSRNVVMMGAASNSIPLKTDSLRAAVAKLVPSKTVDVNLKAFDIGRAAGMECGKSHGSE
jgi:indolepyruvate ferredoxin oxidoreductase beta subunit